MYVKKTRVMFSGRSFEMNQVMPDFMEQRKYMLTTRFMRVDQDALFAGEKFPVNIIREITDKFNFQAKEFGHGSEHFIGLMLHLLLGSRCFCRNRSMIL